MSYKQFKVDISVGTSIIKAFERIDIGNYQIFSEFIDNSLQSYIDHADVLKNILHIRKCIVNITWTNDEIVISDNAFGMNEEEFERAIRLNSPKKEYSKDSLSKYGMGLKYAAANLGTVYTIESSAYNSTNRFIGTIDLNDWILNNPKTLDVEVEDDFNLDKHYTVITIKNLKHRYTQQDEKEVIKKLGIIYSHYFDKEQNLEIHINEKKVEYIEPDIYRDENGSEVMEILNNSFVFEGKKYEFSGWIGLLNKGTIKDAGFNLIQNNRVIEISYRPKELVGNGNDYKYQRIVGEINFIGDNWEVRVNKDGIAWKGTGLEDRFLETLKNMEPVKKIQKLAVKRRIRENPIRKIKVESTNANYDGIKSEYKIGERVCFHIKPADGYDIKSVKVEKNELIAINDNNDFSFNIDAEMPNTLNLKILCSIKTEEKNIVNTKEEDGAVVVEIKDKQHSRTMTKREKIQNGLIGMKETSIPGELNLNCPNLYKEGIVVEYSNTKFSFDVKDFSDSNIKEWFVLKEKPNFENSYEIYLNYNAGFFNGVFFTEDTKIAIIKLCISLALARITGASLGLSLEKSKIMIDKLNDIIFKNR